MISTEFQEQHRKIAEQYQDKILDNLPEQKILVQGVTLDFSLPSEGKLRLHGIRKTGHEDIKEEVTISVAPEKYKNKFKNLRRKFYDKLSDVAFILGKGEGNRNLYLIPLENVPQFMNSVNELKQDFRELETEINQYLRKQSTGEEQEFLKNVQEYVESQSEVFHGLNLNYSVECFFDVSLMPLRIDTATFKEIASDQVTQEMEKSIEQLKVEFARTRKKIIERMIADLNLRFSGILQIEKSRYGMERIGGYTAVKDYIRKSIIEVMKNTSLAQKLNLEPARGILLFGMGGTGKTLLARGLAQEAQLPFFRLQTSDIFSKYVGESERKIRDAVEIIEENAPCIVFIDEIDQLGHRTNSDGDSGTSRRVFSHILEWLGREERKAIIIGATNTPEHLDEAFVREGRFEVSIPMLLPDPEARHAIFNVHLHVKRNLEARLEGSLGSLERFAEQTQGFTGAEIEGMIIRASRTAFDEKRGYLTEQDLQTAINSYNINSEDRKKSQERFLETAHKICHDKQFLLQLEQEHAVKSRADVAKERIA